MNLSSVLGVSFRLRALLMAALACACACAAADDGSLARARQRGQLVVGVDHVVLPYTAGAKFRTPEGLGLAFAEDLAQRLQLSLATRRSDAAARKTPPAAGASDLLLVAIADNDPLYRSATVVPTGYSAGPMAIMRTDTTIKSWAQLKGRTVCVAEGGLYRGTLAARYGAIERPFRAPADALLALRVGECDAAVHDSAMLEELITLPEWKKFSARLPTGARTSLVLVAPPGDADSARVLKQVADAWRTSKFTQQQLTKSVRNIAFEVYLDQNVPDCH